jgi:hypothetical protein
MALRTSATFKNDVEHLGSMGKASWWHDPESKCNGDFFVTGVERWGSKHPNCVTSFTVDGRL